MESMKKQFGQEEPEAREKRQKQLVGVNFINLALNIAMVKIFIYLNTTVKCKKSGPRYYRA